MLPAPLEITLWFVVIVFPVSQIVFTLWVNRDVDDVISFVTSHWWRFFLFLVLYLPFFYAILYAVVHLCSGDPDAWCVATAIVLLSVGFLTFFLLYALQTHLFNQALIAEARRTASNASDDA